MSGPRSTAAWQRARLRVLAEESRCWICGSSEFVDVPRHPRSRSVDHVVALKVGGRLIERGNLRLSCYGCNASKGAGAAGRRWLVDARSEDW